MKNKLAKKMVTLFLVFIMICSVCACSGSKDEIQNVIDEFEYSCQNLDIDAMLNCIDPSVAQPIRALILAASLLTGTDAEDATEDAMDMAVNTVFGESYEPREFLKGLSIEDEKISVKTKNATVDCKIVFEIAGERFNQNTTIKLKNKDDAWYISGISLRK